MSGDVLSGEISYDFESDRVVVNVYKSGNERPVRTAYYCTASCPTVKKFFINTTGLNAGKYYLKASVRSLEGAIVRMSRDFKITD